jgi:hypothetical protein
LCLDRSLWKQLEKAFVAERLWRADLHAHAVVDPHYQVAWPPIWQKALAPNYAPKCLIGCRIFILCSYGEVMDTCIGAVRSKSLLNQRLLQTHFLLSQSMGGALASPEGCFVRISSDENAAVELARCAAALDMNCEHTGLPKLGGGAGGTLVVCPACYTGPAGSGIASAIWFVGDNGVTAMSTEMLKLPFSDDLAHIAVMRAMQSILWHA